ncbi:YcdB/YcdC domain-containing protein [Lysinibacillus sp. NPDC097231]|uniref:YcdB/YcdC domain-containing protein n=1 Tax=Lysinibacillus sp. NPDC097231 TaxID=3364142 RepID=UPI00380F8BA4
MGKFKKLGIILTSTAFSVGVLSPITQASANVKESPEKIEIQVASTDTKVSKSMLIKQLHTLFPDKFNFVSDNEFYTGSGHYFRDDKTIRYDLSFYKTVNGKDVNGSFTFKGDGLELESFYYQPANIAEAVYPAKYSEAEAQKFAQNFLKRLENTENYKLREDGLGLEYYVNTNRPISEPITYSFVYSPMHNGVVISDEYISINVLANGEITSMYRNGESISSKATFDGLEQKKDAADILAQVRDNLAIELRYAIDYDYQTSDRRAKLVYAPVTGFNGVHALTGQWQTANGFSSQVPKTKSVEKLSSQPLAPRKSDMTIAEAEELAKSLLKVDSDKEKLQIDMVNERENENGETIYSVNYMYVYGNSSSGSSVEINKATGEIIYYSDIRRDFTNTNKTPISKDAAFTKAIEYLKQLVPSYLHEYSMPIDEPAFNKYSNEYYFSFPRIVNGIAVVGDEISVNITSDGSLGSLYTNKQKIDNWPSVSNAIAIDKAKESYSQALELQLQYAKQDTDDKQHYNLVYSPIYGGNLYNQIDATTGKWLFNKEESTNKPLISHPTAANELNYLLNQNVLDVKDPANFNADTAVTKGEALKVLVKSLTYYYGYYGDEGDKQSFNNIDKKHPLYGVAEQAVRMGILKPATQLDVDATLTRQELAEWYIRALGLEKAAKHGDIYKLNFADANSIDPGYAGYVALANALGLFDTQNNKFNATEKVTYADLAVSAIRLARAASEDRGSRNYY